jgi:methylated-DNA-[protein]-cysteine S-methyltransferase
MRPIVKSDVVRVERTRYAVQDWGEGELWTEAEVVLAHDFRFASNPGGPGARSAVARTPVSDTGSVARGATSRAGVAREARPGARVPLRGLDHGCGAIETEPERLSLDTHRCLTPNELVERFRLFLGGEDVRFDDVPLDLDSSTPFQHAVALALRAVPRGEVVTYGELAAIAGYPGAQRAVGTVCARNRFMLLVPCHRVVAADGIGRYGSAGIGVKRRLLALEGVAL